MKQGNKSNKTYIEAEKKASSTVYQAKCKTEKKGSGNLLWRDDQKCNVFMIAKRMIKTNLDITGE